MPDEDINKDNELWDAEEILREAAEAIINKVIEQTPLPDECLSLEETKKILYKFQVQKIELEMQNNELRLRQEELFNLNKRFFDLYNDSPVGYVTLNEEDEIIESNSTVADLLQVEQLVLIDQPFTRFIAYEDQDLYYLFRKKIKFHDTYSCELRMKRNNGVDFFVNITAKKSKTDDQRDITYLVINDISEQMKTEEALKAKDKMMSVQSRFAVMGEMISMIAHQWRQPLSAVSITVSSLQMKQDADEYEKEFFDEQLASIERCVQHMSETIDDFRNFFKDDKEAVLITLPELVLDTLEIIDPILKDMNIEIKTEFLNDEEVSTYQNEIKQVLLNILNNSRDVIEERRVQNPTITIKTYKEAERYCIAIQDNAGGIPENIIDRIFEPYFTTKESYNGTGLGLYISKSIIHEHCKGKIEVKNSQDGALFLISLKSTPS